MHPNQIHPNSKREYTPNEKYWMHQQNGNVLPRSLSQYAPPSPEFIPVVAISKTQLARDDAPLPHASSSMDASEIKGNQVGFNQGDQLQNRRKISRGHHVSNPEALHDPDVRERVKVTKQEVADTPPVQTEAPVPTPNRKRRSRKSTPDASLSESVQKLGG